MKSLVMHMVTSLSRVSANFLKTAWALLYHPWNVIKDYIYGKRVGLVSPVVMLVLLALYWGVLMAVIPHYRMQHDAQVEAMGIGGMLKWIYGSLTFQYLFLAIPVAAGTWIVYRRDMRGRFNFAELLIATLYMACTFLLVDFVLSPLELVSEALVYVLIVTVTTVYAVIGLLKAFPQRTASAAVGRLLLWGLVCGGLLMLFLIIFALPMISSMFMS